MSPRKKMKNRVFREYDEYWEAAQKMADERNDNLSEKIREFIRAYPRDGCLILRSSDIEFLLRVLDDKIPELSNKSSPRLDALRDELRHSLGHTGKVKSDTDQSGRREAGDGLGSHQRH